MTFDPDAPAAGEGLFGLPFTPEEARVVVLPVPWQATTSYRRGTAGGPAALLRASRQVDLFDLEYGEFWQAGIALADEDPAVARWDAEAERDALAVIAGTGDDAAIARVNALSDKVNTSVYRSTCRLLDAGKIPAVVGGDHSVPFGALRAVSERHPGIGILHVDAHADLREAYEGFTYSHASIFHNVVTRLPGVGRLVQVGIRDVGAAEVAFIRAHPERVATFFDQDVARELAGGTPWLRVVEGIVARLPPEVWISVDVDGLDPAYCPHTGTPVPGGLSFRDLLILIAETSRARRIVGFDVNEIGDDEWDGNVAARILYKLCGAAIRSR
ncbi:MAG: agmatinase family protein [Myxococcota bacterium]